jgi:predicted enzyme related to lactoylglutathione lyase
MSRTIVALVIMVLATGIFGAFCQEESEGAQAHPVLFWELASDDADASAEFFRQVFDWDVSFDEGLGFYQVPAGEACEHFSGGYIFTLEEAKLPFLTVYILVEDIEAMAGLVKEKGGHIVEPPRVLGKGYKICLFNEPSGITFAMFQPAPE